MSDLKYCVQCPFHERVADPDPDDWCDDEEFDQKHDLENNEVTDEIAIEYMEKHKTDTW